MNYLLNNLLNRNRCRQALSEDETGSCFEHTVYPWCCQQERRKIVYCVVSKCKELLAKLESWKIVFPKIESKSPTTENQNKNTVSINLNFGLHCTREMAIEHLDELVSMLIETRIAPELKKIEPGVWNGKIDTAGICAHYETPQFINCKKSEFFRKKGVCRKWRRLWWAEKRKLWICDNTALYKFQSGPSSLPNGIFWWWPFSAA